MNYFVEIALAAAPEITLLSRWRCTQWYIPSSTKFTQIRKYAITFHIIKATHTSKVAENDTKLKHISVVRLCRLPEHVEWYDSVVARPDEYSVKLRRCSSKPELEDCSVDL